MDEIKLSDDLIDKLITDKELKERYKINGLCKHCKQPNTDRYSYCQPCYTKNFQQNFKNWTSGNHDVDEFIQKAQLKVEKFKTVWKDGYIDDWDYVNNQWKRIGETKVALKCLHNSQNITTDFLNEIESNIIVCKLSSGHVVRCFGITKDPKTNDFIMVMKLINGSLRQYLSNNFISLSWKKKLGYLIDIAHVLRDIHNKGLIHRDFHCENILSDFNTIVYIADLGLYQPANVKSSQNSNKKIYGILPYVAPEVLRGKEYTQSSDIYGFGIIAYKICTSNYKIPQLIFDLINQCWDAAPLKRPKADELLKLLENLYDDIIDNVEGFVIIKQIKETDEINKKSSFSIPSSSTSSTLIYYMTHPQAIYTSRLLDFKNLPEPKNADNDDLEYSDSLRMDFTKLDINSKDERN
ncbi:kinase-like domain-containing protein [Rhizophagus irregularis DAOM 181602=DAOM 197198]|nr:kinase-like domain-containing protein [Rhizophagus irregularis DAOM 181602=DAOM 197198]